MKRFEQKAFITVEAENEEEAWRVINDMQEAVEGFGLGLLSCEDSPIEEVGDDGD